MAAPVTIPPAQKPVPAAPASRRSWRIAGSILAASAILLATANVWSAAGGLVADTETQHETYRHAVSRVELDLDDGAIVLSRGDDDRVEIQRRLEWLGRRPTIRETWAGDTLTITVRCANRSTLGTRPRCAVAYTMRVPAGVEVDARTVASRIDVRDLGGSLRLTGSSGDVTVSGTTGPLRVRTSSGGITVTGARTGRAEIQATSGDIELRFAAPPETLTVTTGAGNVDVAVPGDDAYDVTVRTARGEKDISVRHESAAARSIGVTTSRGDVRIRYGSR